MSEPEAEKGTEQTQHGGQDDLQTLIHIFADPLARAGRVSSDIHRNGGSAQGHPALHLEPESGVGFRARSGRLQTR
jgi:hypothetical protein